MKDGPITSLLSVSDAAGNTLSKAGNTVILDQGLGEQAQLTLTVESGSKTPIGHAAAGAVVFAVGGLQPVDVGSVTFTDSRGASVVIAISGAQSSYGVDLSSLADGAITSSLSVTSGAGAAFTPVAGDAVTLDQALGEQAALALTVASGATTPIGAAAATHVAFAIAGLEPGDTGTVIFANSRGGEVSVAVNGGRTHYVVNLSPLADGAISSSLAVATDAAGNSFTPVAGNALTLAQDLGEQAALALTVEGGSSTPIGAAGASSVPFTIAGLLSDDTGLVTFRDGSGHRVEVAVDGSQTTYTADLSTLSDGTIASSLQVATDAAGNSFAAVAGNAVTLEQDLAEQAALRLGVDGGAEGALIPESGSANVSFTLAGLMPDDAGVVTFTDAHGAAVAVAVNGSQTTYAADLSSLVKGAVTAVLAVGRDAAGNAFAPVAGNSIAIVADPAELSVVPSNTIDFGVVHVGDIVDRALEVANAAASGAFPLDASIQAVAGAATAAGGPIVGLAPGDTSTAIEVGLDTTNAGVESGTVTLAEDSDLGNGATAFPSTRTVQVEGTVDNYAASRIEKLGGYGELTPERDDLCPEPGRDDPQRARSLGGPRPAQRRLRTGGHPQRQLHGPERRPRIRQLPRRLPWRDRRAIRQGHRLGRF